MTEPSKGWRAGDLAVCLGNGDWWKDADGAVSVGPEHEQVVRVSFVVFGVDGYDDGIGLEFEGWPNELYPARLFRRIDPDHSAADDAEIIALIKGGRVGAAP